MKIVTPATRTCPECEDVGLEITEKPNTFECQICGAIWKLVKSSKYKEITNVPEKLKKVLEG